MESIYQPEWSPDGILHFISDRTGWWNLYRFDDSGTFCVLEDAADYSEPAWQFGMRSCTPAGGDHVLIVRQGERGEEVALVNTATTLASPFLGDDDRCIQKNTRSILVLQHEVLERIALLFEYHVDLFAKPAEIRHPYAYRLGLDAFDQGDQLFELARIIEQ